jgi:SAM-dependent methyltransferase
MSTPNPWSLVSAAEYERYMGPAGVDQAATLSALFQEAWLAAQPDRVLVVGCATGNGLEHVDPAVTRRVVGLDVNLPFLGICRQRFFRLGPRLELYCASATTWKAPPGSFDLVHAALVLEYLPPAALVEQVAGWLAPGGTCQVVLQLPGGEGRAAAQPVLELIRRAARLVPPGELAALMARRGLALRRSRTVPLPHGASLWSGAFSRGARA